MTGYWWIMVDTGHRSASPHQTALRVASSLSFPRVPHERGIPKKSVGVSASPLQTIRHECRCSVTHGGSLWAWPSVFHDLLPLRKNWEEWPGKKDFRSRNHLRFTWLGFYNLVGTSPALGLCKQACVCVCACVCPSKRFSLRWICASSTVTYSTLKLYPPMSHLHFPGTRWRASS